MQDICLNMCMTFGGGGYAKTPTMSVLASGCNYLI